MKVKFGAVVLIVVVVVLVGLNVTKNYDINNGSMRPTLPIGAKVFVQSETHYKVGDMITFRAVEIQGKKSLVVTHRLIGLNKDGSYITKGDANESQDYPAFPVTKKDVIGKVAWSVPVAGYVTIWIRANLLWVYVGLVCVLLLVIASFIPSKKREKDDDVVENVPQGKIPELTPSV